MYWEKEKFSSESESLYTAKKDYDMKNILITGAAGFIGYHLARLLCEMPVRITVIDNLSRGKSDEDFASLINKKNVTYIQADMTDARYLAQLDGHYDEIYHLAAINGTKHFYERPQEVLRVNILSLLFLLEWVDSVNCGKFLFTSSSEAYAGTIRAFPDAEKTLIPTKEEVPLCIDNVFNERYSYGGSKLVGELLTINYMRCKKVPFTIVRYHNVYGPRMGFEHVIPEFSRRIFDKEDPFDVFGGEDTRAFCYITDAVDATTAVMKSEQCDGQVIHIGNSNEEIVIEELARKMINISNLNVPLNIHPTREGSVSRRCPDTSKLSALTGYSPLVSLDEGLHYTMDWYMEYYSCNE